jgi:AcrR family transcriptional regulator
VPGQRPGPVGGKRHQNRQRRIRELTEAALALFLAQGIEGVTIDEIVRAAGVAKGSFYRYFDDKTALVETLATPVTARIREGLAHCEAALVAARTPGDLFDAYAHIAEALMAVLEQAPDVVRLYLQESRSPAVGARSPMRAFSDEVADRAIAVSVAAQHHDLLRPLDPRVTALAVVGAVERLAYEWLSGRDLGPAASIPSDLIDMVLDGIRPRD